MIPAYYDQSGSLVMGPRTTTPMRLVSPAPVLVPQPPQNRPPQASLYPQPPQTAQQNIYQQQNGSGVGGNHRSFVYIYLIYLHRKYFWSSLLEVRIERLKLVAFSWGKQQIYTARGIKKNNKKEKIEKKTV